MNKLSAKIMQSGILSCKILFVSGIIFFGCKDNKPGTSTPPELWYLSNRQVLDADSNSSIVITLGYRDIEGDIGLDLNDTFPPHHAGSTHQFNLHVNLYEWNNGKEDTIFEDRTNRYSPQIFHQRIPDITPTGRNKRIEGTIEISFPVGPLTLYPDIIKGYFQLTDQKLLSSEIISSELIYLEH